MRHHKCLARLAFGSLLLLPILVVPQPLFAQGPAVAECVHGAALDNRRRYNRFRSNDRVRHYAKPKSHARPKKYYRTGHQRVVHERGTS